MQIKDSAISEKSIQSNKKNVTNKIIKLTIQFKVKI